VVENEAGNPAFLPELVIHLPSALRTDGEMGEDLVFAFRQAVFAVDPRSQFA